MIAPPGVKKELVQADSDLVLQNRAIQGATPKIDNSYFKPTPLAPPLEQRKAQLIDVSRQWNPQQETKPSEETLIKAGKITGVSPNTDQNKIFITEALTTAKHAYGEALKPLFGEAWGTDIVHEKNDAEAKRKSAEWTAKAQNVEKEQGVSGFVHDTAQIAAGTIASGYKEAGLSDTAAATRLADVGRAGGLTADELANAIRKSGGSNTLINAVMNELGPSHALAAEMTFETGQRNSRQEMERKLQEADELSEKLIKDWKDGKKVDPSLLAEVQAIEKAKEISANTKTLSADPVFHEAFETHNGDEWNSHILSSTPSKGGTVRNAADLSTYSPALQIAMLAAYRKSLEDYQKRRQG